jgi:hypothetical protein
MPRDDRPELDEQRHKVEAANAQLARHERLTRLALLLSAVLLALVVNHL